MVCCFIFEGFKIDEDEFQKVLNCINYVKGGAPVFGMPYYIIKSGKRWVITGEYIHFVKNEMFPCDFIISPFINGVFDISQFHHED